METKDFFKLKKLRKDAFILFSSVKQLKIIKICFECFKKLKNYGDIFCKLAKHRFDFLHA